MSFLFVQRDDCIHLQIIIRIICNSSGYKSVQDLKPGITSMMHPSLNWSYFIDEISSMIFLSCRNEGTLFGTNMGTDTYTVNEHGRFTSRNIGYESRLQNCAIKSNYEHYCTVYLALRAVLDILCPLSITSQLFSSVASSNQSLKFLFVIWSN